MNESLLRAHALVMEPLPEATLLLCADTGQVLAANAAAAALWGRPAADLCARRLADLCSDDPQSVRDLLRLGARNRQFAPGGLHLRTAVGQKLPCRTDCAALGPADPADAAGPTWLMLRLRRREQAAGRFIELTQRIDELSAEMARRRRAESELRAQHEWLRTLLLSIGDAVIATDAEGHVALMNGVAERLTGWSRAEALGQPVDEVMLLSHGPTGEPVPNPARQVLIDGEVCWLQRETELTARDGTVWPVDDSAAPIRGAKGELLGAIIVFREITEHVRSERERLALEHQLRHSQKMQAVGTLAGGIAHDFNNVVAAILSNAALLREDLAGQQGPRERVLQIEQAGTRARRLVRQILTFSQREARAAVAQDLRPLVDSAMTFLRGALPSLVQLRTVLPPVPVVATVDAVQIEQVLLNLCTNAWHALGGSSGRVVVGLERVPALPPGLGTALEPQLIGQHAAPQRPHVHLWVRDSGCGMDAALRERIFDPFFTTKARSEGTGLGLAVVHGIVREHGGHIQVSSEPGEGSCFDIYLPLSELRPGVQAAAPEAPRRAPVSGDQRRVLYVDDDEVLVMTVQALLDRRGFEAVAVESGAAALRELRAATPAFDLLVTDSNMPVMSGLDLVRAVRASHPVLPVILTSGYVSRRLLDEARHAGVDAVLRKEDMADQLPDLILQVLAGDKAPLSMLIDDR